MGDIGPGIIIVIGGIISLAMIAVLVSKKADTSQVLQTGGTALAGIIGAAVAPVVSGGGNQFGQ